MEHSVAKNEGYCFYCYLSLQNRSEKSASDIFTGKGYNNWKKALQAFNQHVVPMNNVHNYAS